MPTYRFARDFEVFVSEANYTLSREPGYSTPGFPRVAAADLIVKAVGPATAAKVVGTAVVPAAAPQGKLTINTKDTNIGANTAPAALVAAINGAAGFAVASLDAGSHLVLTAPDAVTHLVVAGDAGVLTGLGLTAGDTGPTPGPLLDTYVEAAAANAVAPLTPAQIESARIALSRDDGDGFAAFARQGEFKAAVAHWPVDAGLAATIKAVLTSKSLIGR